MNKILIGEHISPDILVETLYLFKIKYHGQDE